MKALTGIFVATLFASGQQPAARAPDSQQPTTVFSVTSTLVQVDAVVTDSKGRHITDLKPEDFQVFEDGKLQKLTHFSYVQVAPEHKAAPELKAERPKRSPNTVSALPPPALAQPRPEDVRRTIVLMVDDLGLSFESMAFVRGSLHKFVNQQMQPGDLVAICRTGAGSGALQQFSVDKRVLLSVIDGLHWNPNGRFGLSYFDPYGKFGPAGASGFVPSGDSRSLDVRYDIENTAITTVGTLGAVNYIVGALREMPGRKSIVLFSDGIQLFESPGTGESLDSYADVTAALRRLIDRANRSGTVIYTIHATGLQTLQMDAQDNPQLDQMTRGEANGALNAMTHIGGGRDVVNNVLQQDLAYLADKTGGLAYYNGNDLNWGLQRVLEDQEGYYLLGYQTPEGTLQRKNGRSDYHRIQVKVTRAGLHVRSRSGFFGETDDETLPSYTTPAEQLRATMLSPFQSSGVGVRLTALYAEAPKRGPVVRNLLRINAADLTWKLDDQSNDWAQVMLVGVATGASDQPLAAVGRVFDLRVAPGKMAEALRDGALYTLDVPVPKRGAYQIRVAVRDQTTGKIGSATQFLEIPELKKKGFALASVILQDGDRSARPDMLDIVPALRQFKRGSSLEYFCAVEKGRKKGPDVDMATRVRVLRDGKEVYSTPARLIDMPVVGRVVFGALKLGDNMTPGDYYLQVIVAERNAAKGTTGAAAGQWTDFTVVP
ncbi:MAG TPA: VWA domain-containing protein [Bryobacteraceae bacterium]